MKKIIVLRHSCDSEEERHQHQESDIIHSLPYEKAAKALMGASGYVAYVAKHGYHFTKQLAIKASEQMKNVDGTSHRWTVDEIRLATNNEIISKGTTIGDILYLANMAYADFYPKVIKTLHSLDVFLDSLKHNIFSAQICCFRIFAVVANSLDS
jgi:hypothetical protein